MSFRKEKGFTHDSSVAEPGKIAIVANTAWYIYNFRSNLIHQLIAQGWHVALIAPYDEYFPSLEKIPKVDMYQLKYLSRKGRNPLQDLRLYREVYKIYAHVRPDVVLQYTIKPNIYGSLAANLLRIPSLSVVPGLGHAFIKPGFLRSVVMMLYKRSLRTNTFTIFENAGDMNELIDAGIIPGHQAVSFNGCGVDTAHFTPLPRTQASSGLKFLFIGRLIKEKGVAEFIQAAHQVHQKFPEVLFYIAGNIDLENPGGFTLEELRKLTDFQWIEYLGFVQDVRQIIREVDCVVLPSYYPEGLPRVLLESMSMEKPVISTDSRGCRDAIEVGRNGLLTSPKDIGDLARKMIALCEMSCEKRLAMGKYGREKVLREFDDKLINQRYLDLLSVAVTR